ncbi:MAG: CheR family methyltransferase [Thermodesulfobacteriota bacterium]
MTDDEFRQILDHFRLSWRGYRKVRKRVKKRLARHMIELQCRTVRAYLDKVLDDSHLTRHVEALLTVTISRFLRDRRLWECLEREIFPDIAHMELGRVKIWCAGCASGEEAYSIAMIWDRSARALRRAPEAQIWATDTNPEALDRAQKGIYARSSLKEVKASLLNAHFTDGPVPETFMVSESLKKYIRWELHDFMRDDPRETDFAMIFLRNNLLTYHRIAEQEAALARILNNLLPGGFLVIGVHESVPRLVANLKPHSCSRMILRKSER